MGTDIRACLEKKKDGKWYFVKELELYRDYDSFSLLDGTRPLYHCEPIMSKPRVAENITEETISRLLFYFESYEIRLDDLRNYKYWYIPFIDSRRPKGHTGPVKSGGVYKGEVELSVDDYETMTPIECIKNSHLFVVLFKELKSSDFRVVYSYDW